MRALRGCVSWLDFSGFCGETSQINRSSPSRRSAVSATWAWPSCAGLNEPPYSPTFIPGDRWNPSRNPPGRPDLGVNLAGPANHMTYPPEGPGRTAVCAHPEPYLVVFPNTAIPDATSGVALCGGAGLQLSSSISAFA